MPEQGPPRSPAPPESDQRLRAQRLLAETAHFAALGLGDLAHLARDVARDSAELCDALEQARSLAQDRQERLAAYTAYHQAHCFLPGGDTRSGAPAAAFRGT